MAGNPCADKGKMKVLVKYDKTRTGMALRELPMPEPQEGEIRLKIKAVGICGSDIHAMNDERQTAIPIVLGHEFVGVIDKTCGDTGNLKVGDWVTGIPAAYNCEVCEYCRRGEVTLCPEHKSLGVYRDGAMAEYMVTRAKYAFKIPEEVHDKSVYAIVEPLACVVRGVYELLDVHSGDVAVVSGPGAIGLLAVEVLKSRGAYVIVSGLPIDNNRLELALRLGANVAVQSYKELEAAVKAVSQDGADVAVETAGVGASLNECLKILKVHGNLLELGIISGEHSMDFGLLFSKELRIIGSNSSTMSSWEIALNLLNDERILLEPLIDLRLPLEEWGKGFDAIMNKTACKVLLMP